MKFTGMINMKTKQMSIVLMLIVTLLALVPNVNATGYMDGSNWTGIDNILDSYGFSYLKNNTGLSNPATADLDMSSYNITNADNITDSDGDAYRGNEPCSYVVYKVGSTVYARNCTTSKVDYSGTNFSLVVGNAFTAMPKTGIMILSPSLSGTTIPSTINMNLALSRGFTLLGDVGLVPTAGIGDAFFIYNGYDPLIKLKVVGGGQWSTNDNFVHIRGVRDGEFWIYGTDYAGTVLNFSVNGTNEPKTSKVTVKELKTERIGRSICVCGDGTAWSSAFGIIENAWMFYNTHEELFQKYSDITIGHIEGGNMTFKTVGSVYIDSIWNGGDIIMEDVRDMHINAFGNTEGYGHGLYIGNSTDYTNGRGVSIGSLLTRNIDGPGLEIYNSRSIWIDRFQSINDDVGLKIHGSSSNDIHIGLDILAAKINGTEIGVGVSRTTLTGYIGSVNSSEDPGKTFGLVIDSGEIIELNGLIIEGSADQTSALYISNPTNYVNMIGGWLTHPTNKSYGYTPRGVINVNSFSPYNFGNRATAPTASGAGDTYSNTTDKQQYFHDGIRWITGYGEGGFTLTNGTNDIAVGTTNTKYWFSSGIVTALSLSAVESGNFNLSVNNTATGCLNYITLSSAQNNMTSGLNCVYNAGDRMNFTVISNSGIHQVSVGAKYTKTS